MIIRSLAVVVGLVTALSLSTTQATAVSYIINSPTQSDTAVSPFQNPETVSTFYQYGGDSEADPDEITLNAQEALFFLYEDTTTSILSLVTIFDTPDGGAAGSAAFTISGAPTGATVVVEDDPGDSFPAASAVNGSYAFNWISGFTDGFAAEGFENLLWTVLFSDFVTSGITTFSFLDGGGSRLDLGNLAATGATLSISAVPVPAPFLLLLSGIVALCVAGRQRGGPQTRAP